MKAQKPGHEEFRSISPGRGDALRRWKQEVQRDLTIFIFPTARYSARGRNVGINRIQENAAFRRSSGSSASAGKRNVKYEWKLGQGGGNIKSVDRFMNGVPPLLYIQHWKYLLHHSNVQRVFTSIIFSTENNFIQNYFCTIVD